MIAHMPNRWSVPKGHGCNITLSFSAWEEHQEPFCQIQIIAVLPPKKPLFTPQTLRIFPDLTGELNLKAPRNWRVSTCQHHEKPPVSFLQTLENLSLRWILAQSAGTFRSRPSLGGDACSGGLRLSRCPSRGADEMIGQERSYPLATQHVGNQWKSSFQ